MFLTEIYENARVLMGFETGLKIESKMRVRKIKGKIKKIQNFFATESTENTEIQSALPAKLHGG